MSTLEILLTVICILLGFIVILCLPRFFLWLTVIYDEFFGNDNKKAKKKDIDKLQYSIDKLINHLYNDNKG